MLKFTLKLPMEHNMRQIIACPYVSANDIYVRDEGAHFIVVFRLSCTNGQQFGVVCSKFISPLAILWLAFHLPQVHTRSAIKRHTSTEVTRSLPLHKVSSYGGML